MSDLRQIQSKRLTGPFVSHAFKRPWNGTGLENPRNRSAFECLIPQGMIECPIDVFRQIGFFLAQNCTGLETAVLGELLHETVEKFPGGRAQGKKCFSNRLETITVTLRSMMHRVFDFLAAAWRAVRAPGCR